MKSVCFIGHRNANLSNEEIDYLKSVLINLIKNGVDNFLFGSRSSFNNLCLNLVAELQKEFNHIKIVGYPCTHESFFLKNEKSLDEIASKIIGKKINFMKYDKIVEGEYSGKFSYVERNQKMILDSDICIFYCNKNYVPAKVKDGVGLRQAKSGTLWCFNYANKLKKEIIDICKN